ncbi:hypothetical protein GMOD_00003919 [Pyrenophora seminiperda CCB06]|uniref:Uncharacterized protein n=1 Tax=Pyrenophora seminiperda CCB06 TaxID=1302712 RepID=A0A3M7M026_9PLEO|nr:hypothetical protein GMOD_00003919 [Pyrenophora seminiperda CCB06]
MKQKLDGPKLRADVDARSRLGLYAMTKQQAILQMQPHTAQSIYEDFVAHKSKMDHGSNVRRIVKSGF